MENSKYSKEAIVKACSNCTSIRCVLSNLGLAPNGGHSKLRSEIKTILIELDLYLGQSYNRGKTFIKKRNEDIFKNPSSLQSNKVRLHLLKRNLKEYKCEKCLNNEWLDVKIPLEVHHKDGNKFNNELNNLQLLCPNCHALTDNYRGKNIGSYD